MRKIILFIGIFFFAISVFAQEENNYGFSDEIGVHAGFTTGFGFSYRYWIPEGYGVQLTALPIKTDYVEFVSVGVTGLRCISNGRIVRSFAYLGNHLLWDRYNSMQRFQYNAGLGFGMEFGLYPKFNIMLGYGGYNIPGELWLIPTIEAGFYFDFNKRGTIVNVSF